MFETLHILYSMAVNAVPNNSNETIFVGEHLFPFQNRSYNYQDEIRIKPYRHMINAACGISAWEPGDCLLT